MFLPGLGHQRHFAWVWWVEERHQGLGCSPVRGWGGCLFSSQAFSLTCQFRSFVWDSGLATDCSFFLSVLLQLLSLLDEVSIKRHDKGQQLSRKNTHVIKVGGNENRHGSSPMFVGSCPSSGAAARVCRFQLVRALPHFPSISPCQPVFPGDPLFQTKTWTQQHYKDCLLIFA